MLPAPCILIAHSKTPGTRRTPITPPRPQDPYLPSPTPGAPERRAAFLKYIQMNLTAAFLLSEALAPLMPRGQASIIHISSTRAQQSEPHSEVRRTPAAAAAPVGGLVGILSQSRREAGRSR